MKLLLIFFLLSFINVIFSTIRSIVTINGSKIAASVWSAGYFAFYNVVLVYSVADFPLWQKCLITFLCNLIGVYIAKFIEEKTHKEKMWKVEMAIPADENLDINKCYEFLDKEKIPYNSTLCGEWWIFNCYCPTKANVKCCIGLCERLNGKISAYENKLI